MKRRDVIKAMAAGVAGAATMSSAETPTPKAPALTVADLATADRVAGRSYTPAERKLMLARVTEIRDRLKSLREADLPSTEPALQFDPRLPGMRLPRGKSRVRMSRGPLLPFSGDSERLAFM